MGSKEKTTWDHTASMLGKNTFSFGPHWSFNFRADPKRLGFVLSRYKFAARMCKKCSSILELGCSDGIGAPIVQELATSYTGVDLDEKAIASAQKNLAKDGTKFIYDDFLGKTYGTFQAVISLDVIEHIFLEHEGLYCQTVVNNLDENGICVIGTPNITAAGYASKASELGHVNLYSQERLKKKLEEFFHTVFSFGMNDEVMHTGFGSMAHYLLCVACHKKKR